MTTPSDTELREQLEELALHMKPGTTKGTHRTAVFDTLELTKLVQILIQAREQQLIAELLDSKQECTIRNTNPKTRIMRWHSQEGEAVPVSVIERLQNKTNDGGSDGDSD